MVTLLWVSLQRGGRRRVLALRRLGVILLGWGILCRVELLVHLGSRLLLLVSALHRGLLVYVTSILLRWGAVIGLDGWERMTVQIRCARGLVGTRGRVVIPPEVAMLVRLTMWGSRRARRASIALAAFTLFIGRLGFGFLSRTHEVNTPVQRHGTILSLSREGNGRSGRTKTKSTESAHSRRSQLVQVERTSRRSEGLCTSRLRFRPDRAALVPGRRVPLN